MIICAALRLPFTALHVAEAYAVTIVASLLLLSIGNLTSLYSPRRVDPARAMRSARSGRIQGLMLVVYPVVALPLFLAYAARYAFNSEAAFFGVVALTAIFAGIAYSVAMETAVEMAEKKKEAIVSTLSRGEGPVE
jgi:ABC-2 type transport system permease protein